MSDSHAPYVQCRGTTPQGIPCPREAVHGKTLCSLCDRRGKLTFQPWRGDFRPHLKRTHDALRAAQDQLRTVASEMDLHTYSGGRNFPNAKAAAEQLLAWATYLDDQVKVWLKDIS